MLFAKGVLVGEGDLGLTDGTWVTHAALAALPAAARAVAARNSWRRAFQFAEEDPHGCVVGPTSGASLGGCLQGSGRQVQLGAY